MAGVTGMGAAGVVIVGVAVRAGGGAGAAATGTGVGSGSVVGPTATLCTFCADDGGGEERGTGRIECFFHSVSRTF